MIGTAAGLAVADDAGRRFLTGVAAAVQFAIFPVGSAAILGFPERLVVMERLGTFLINVVTIGGAGVAVYRYWVCGGMKSSASSGRAGSELHNFV